MEKKAPFHTLNLNLIRKWKYLFKLKSLKSYKANNKKNNLKTFKKIPNIFEKKQKNKKQCYNNSSHNNVQLRK